MIRNYIVRAPFVVRINERVIHKPGEVIALDELTAKANLHKLVEVKPEEETKPVNGPAKRKS